MRKFDEYLPKQKQQWDNQQQQPSDVMDRPVKKVLEMDAREQQKTRQQGNRKPSTGEERQSSRSIESARPFAPPEASTNERHKPWQRRREEMEKGKPPGLGQLFV